MLNKCLKQEQLQTRIYACTHLFNSFRAWSISSLINYFSSRSSSPLLRMIISLIISFRGRAPVSLGCKNRINGFSNLRKVRRFSTLYRPKLICSQYLPKLYLFHHNRSQLIYIDIDIDIPSLAAGETWHNWLPFLAW